MPFIAWVLVAFCLSISVLMTIVAYKMVKKARPAARRRKFKLIKGEDVGKIRNRH